MFGHHPSAGFLPALLGRRLVDVGLAAELLLLEGFVRLPTDPDTGEWGRMDLTRLEALRDSQPDGPVNVVERDLAWRPAAPVSASRTWSSTHAPEDSERRSPSRAAAFHPASAHLTIKDLAMRSAGSTEPLLQLFRLLFP